MEFRYFIESSNYIWHKDGTVTVQDMDLVPWSKVSAYMRRKGYDWRGGEDARRIIEQQRKRFIGDQVGALKYAIEERSPEEKLLTKIKRHFHRTNNLLVAGYILPDGDMLDFSNNSLARQADHREIGQFMNSSGYEGIKEFGERFGAISMHFNGNEATLRIFRKPTNKQLLRIKEIYKRVVHDIQLNMYKGDNSFSKVYGKRDYGYLQDIEEFYGI